MRIQGLSTRESLELARQSKALLTECISTGTGSHMPMIQRAHQSLMAVTQALAAMVPSTVITAAPLSSEQYRYLQLTAEVALAAGHSKSSYHIHTIGDNKY